MKYNPLLKFVRLIVQVPEEDNPFRYTVSPEGSNIHLLLAPEVIPNGN